MRKKKKKDPSKLFRRLWTRSPVTRIRKSKKIYSRKKKKDQIDEEKDIKK